MATHRSLQAILITKDQPAITNRSAQAVAIIQDPPTAMIRNVRGYALTAPPTQTQVRNVRGYALTTVTKAPPAAQVGINAMLWLLNQNLSITTPFTLSQINIGTPSSYSDPTGRSNAQVTVSAKTGSGYRGSMTAYYNRRPLDFVFNSNVPWLLGTISSDTTIRALIPQINSAYGVGLDATDVVDGPVPAGSTSILLTAATGSYMFQPGSFLRIPQFALASVAPLTKLAGFDSASGVGPAPMSTLALNHFDGGNGSTAWVDATGTQVKGNGGIAMSTATSKFGGSSLVMGNSTALSIEYDNFSSLLNGDLTIECWVYLGGRTAALMGLFHKTINGNSSIVLNTAGYPVIMSEDGTKSFSGSTSVALSTWTHLAFVRQNNTWTIYVNGVQSGRAALTSFSDDAAPMMLGIAKRGGQLYPYYGYLDEFRVSRVARYTTNFTPATAAFTLD